MQLWSANNNVYYSRNFVDLDSLSFAAKYDHKRWTNFQVEDSDRYWIAHWTFLSFAWHVKFKLYNIILKWRIGGKYHKTLFGTLVTIPSLPIFHLDNILNVLLTLYMDNAKHYQLVVYRTTISTIDQRFLFFFSECSYFAIAFDKSW